MAVFNKFNSFFEALAHKVHNLNSDQLVVLLTNTAPVAGNAVTADITQISYTNLSTRNITKVSSSQSAGAYKLILQDLVLSASGGAVGPFRYVVIANSTATGGELIGYYDYGAAVTINDGEDFTVDFNATNGLFGGT